MLSGIIQFPQRYAISDAYVTGSPTRNLDTVFSVWVPLVVINGRTTSAVRVFQKNNYAEEGEVIVRSRQNLQFYKRSDRDRPSEPERSRSGYGRAYEVVRLSGAGIDMVRGGGSSSTQP